MNATLWYVGRGAGLVSLVLLTATVALGIVVRSARPLGRLPRFAVQDVHRSLSLLALVFLGVHIGTLVADPEAELRLVDVVVPFTAARTPLWTGLGTVALDVLLALVVTGLLRRRIGRRAFRAVHWLAYALWPVAALHGITNGTDAGRGWFLVVWAGALLVVLAAGLWRVLPGFQERTRHRAGGPIPALATGGRR